MIDTDLVFKSIVMLIREPFHILSSGCLPLKNFLLISLIKCDLVFCKLGFILISKNIDLSIGFNRSSYFYLFVAYLILLCIQ